ncbi:hypothetical protein [Bradyrhizobium elkanii]|jgi:hypothetical protein|uniref:hypothetical protein n=1 Tax=Bradyrhizobium elkanii TaxID=29448 RepID=UPI000486165F|nr:hypothetical protein [Bradyrhizobium elkanii]MCP1927424.1 hypothetical protein [Bradyrhizobium elkanii]MCS3475060.1 hypothetical protein [Bradyrhizobium elkanii]MCS3521064.1 hypothetical protein [Bradyrhizobium elkanii]MCS4068719.1 hypothetical protein [Bradyrhizobium elkanii]MCS4084253.1 hypothetical protein [Bradyrhizobium elkanii]
MVAGIEKFREFFAGHEDHYAIIGGTACDLLFDAAGLPTPPTASGCSSSDVICVALSCSAYRVCGT